VILPRLRTNLDFMPSPAEDRPGLVVRDSFQYSDKILIIPPLLVNGLEFFDGERTELDLRAELTRLTGQLEMGDAARNLIEALSGAGFLENETYEALREQRHLKFEQSPLREAAHSGSAYPETPDDLRGTMSRYLGGDGVSLDGAEVMGIAAPHVSPEGGWKSYRAAYQALSPELSDRTFVVLGTSHYGQPDRFGLTRKAFATPFGVTPVNRKLVDELALQPAALMEDYCHAVEHSIEFQVLFLQAIYGPDIQILPVLCGSFARSIYEGGAPENDEGVRRFLDALGNVAAREGKRLFWVLGIDMAHMGARYGDDFAATANQAEMATVAERDGRRIERVNAGDAGGFWELVRENRDDLKWCGSAPVYSFLKVVPGARGTLRRYEQWNIDEQSVVSFAGISFTRQD
jgi:AmmeMemoRadiSam system protein B